MLLTGPPGLGGRGGGLGSGVGSGGRAWDPAPCTVHGTQVHEARHGNPRVRESWRIAHCLGRDLDQEVLRRLEQLAGATVVSAKLLIWEATCGRASMACAAHGNQLLGRDQSARVLGRAGHMGTRLSKGTVQAGVASLLQSTSAC